MFSIILYKPLFSFISFTAIQLEFDETVYTINEADSMADDVITVTKGGVVSEQVLDGVVQVVALTPYSAELGKKMKLSDF